MNYQGITILDKDLKDVSQDKLFNMHPVMQREGIRKVYNWAQTHNTKIVSIVRLVHPGEAFAFNVDDIITWSGKHFKYGIWKVYGDPHMKENPRKKEMKMGAPDKAPSIKKIMDEIDETPNEYRFRMQPPSKFHEDSLKYGSKPITRGVRAIYGCPKDAWAPKLHRCKKGMAMQSLRLMRTVFKTKESAAKWIAKHTKPRRE